MGKVLNMAEHKFRKLDCQDECVVDIERRISAAGALARCVRLMQEDFGDRFAMESLANEVLRVKGRK